MENPGEYLKKERELRGVALKAVADRLMLKVQTLESLEKDEYEKLPHPTYIKGFIRSYCRVLGLDENDAVLRFEAYLREEAKKDKDTLPEKEASFPKPWFKSNAAVISLVSAGIILVVLYFIFSGGSTRKTQSPVPPAQLSEPSGKMDEKYGSNAPQDVPSTPLGKTPEKPTGTKLLLDLYAKNTTWVMAEIDNKKPFETLLRDGESVRWEAEEVFF
ncbi:MAG: helix-turn-helix domain-containing protein [Deltaproteobacteria bacterium]|nr:helix-turn-helix domain-containing protein [Deltaproteobacteria bacterium]